MSNPAKNSSKSASKSLTIDQKLNQLDAEVAWFRGDEFELGQAIDHYKSALELAKSVKTDVAELKNEIDVLTKDFSKASAAENLANDADDLDDFGF